MRSTSGRRTCSIMSRMRLRRARASRSVWARSTSSIWRPTGTTGLSAVIGSWKIIAMVVARNCRRRRSEAVSSSSPTSFMLPPDGTSEPLCNNPITVSDVTDFPEPLSPTRHSVSRSRTCSEMPSMMRGAFGFFPRPTTRLLMSRTMLVMPPFSPRHCERSEAIHRSQQGLDCFIASAPLRKRFAFVAGNDGVSLAALPLLHAGIERIARGVADQIDAQNRDRQQQPRPKDQRRLYLKIGAALGHNVAPGGRLRADAGAEEREDRLGENGGRADVSALHDHGRNRVRP